MKTMPTLLFLCLAVGFWGPSHAAGQTLPDSVYACCIGDSCLLLPEMECLAMSGIWVEFLDACDPNPCVYGVCCLGWESIWISEPLCQQIEGRWLGAVPCEPNPCPGACCVGTECLFIPLHECDDAGGMEVNPWTECEPNPCIPTPIPPESWGRIKGHYR